MDGNKPLRYHISIFIARVCGIHLKAISQLSHNLSFCINNLKTILTNYCHISHGSMSYYPCDVICHAYSKIWRISVSDIMLRIFFASYLNVEYAKLWTVPLTSLIHFQPERLRTDDIWTHVARVHNNGNFARVNPLQWCNNGCDGVSNHQPHDCLLNR